MFWSQLSDISDEVLEEILKYSNGKLLSDVILKERISKRFGHLTQGYLSRMKSFIPYYPIHWSKNEQTLLRILQRMPQLRELHCDLIFGWNDDDIKSLAANNQSITRLQHFHAVREFVTYIDTVMQTNPLYVYDGGIIPGDNLHEHAELRDLLDKYPHLNMKFELNPGELESKYDHLCYSVRFPNINVRKQYPSVRCVKAIIGEIDDLNLFPNMKTLDVHNVNPRQLNQRTLSSHLQKLHLSVSEWDPLDNEPLGVMINNYPIKNMTINVDEDDTDDVYYEYPLIEIILSSPNNQLTHVLFNKFQVHSEFFVIDCDGDQNPVVTPQQARTTLIKFRRINQIHIYGNLSEEYASAIRNVCDEIELIQRRRKLTVFNGGKMIPTAKIIV